MNDAENQRDAPKWGHPCDCGLWHCTMEDKARADAEWAKLWHRLDAAIARVEQAERERDSYLAQAEKWEEQFGWQVQVTQQAERERDTLLEALERIAGLPNLLANSSVADAIDIARDAIAAVSPPQRSCEFSSLPCREKAYIDPDEWCDRCKQAAAVSPPQQEGEA